MRPVSYAKYWDKLFIFGIKPQAGVKVKLTVISKILPIAFQDNCSFIVRKRFPIFD